MTRLKFRNEAPPSGNLAAHDAVIAACLTILIREAHKVGVKRNTLLKVLRDVPDRIDAALTRGPSTLVVYRFNAGNISGIVTDNDNRLNEFVAQAKADGALVVGLNPCMISKITSELKGCTTEKRNGGWYAEATIH